MMRASPFAYRAPKSVAEIVEVLASEGDGARVLAGGTDLVPNLKRRHQHAKTLVSLSRATELRGVRAAKDGGFEIGAMTTLSSICGDAGLAASHPGFVRAVASISTPTLRNSGTIGGNLCLDTRCTYYNQNEEWRQAISCCMKEAGSTCWVAPGSPRCWAISATDAAPALCALGARVHLVSKAGEREIPLEQLYADDGIRYLTSRRDELLTTLVLPPSDGARSTYWKLRRRGSIDFPVLGVGAAITTQGGKPGGAVTKAAIYLGAVASAPLAAAEAAASLVGAPLDEARIAAAAKLARKLATPLDNTDFTIAWRSAMTEQYVDGALRELAGLPARVKAPKHGAWALAR